jgi:hypothetical protein
MTGERVWTLVGWLVIGGITAPLHAATAQALRVDGTMVQGEWSGCPDPTSVSIRTAAGMERIAFDDLARVSFESQAGSPVGTIVFHLADGGRLHGELVGNASEAVVTRTVLGNAVPIAFDRLAAIQFVRGSVALAKAEELFEAALKARLPAQDVLITRGQEDAKSLRGRPASSAFADCRSF